MQGESAVPPCGETATATSGESPRLESGTSKAPLPPQQAVQEEDIFVKIFSLAGELYVSLHIRRQATVRQLLERIPPPDGYMHHFVFAGNVLKEDTVLEDCRSSAVDSARCSPTGGQGIGSPVTVASVVLTVVVEKRLELTGLCASWIYRHITSDFVAGVNRQRQHVYDLRADGSAEYSQHDVYNDGKGNYDNYQCSGTGTWDIKDQEVIMSFTVCGTRRTNEGEKDVANVHSFRMPKATFCSKYKQIVN